MNTPKTFEYYPRLQYVTFIIDITCVIILTIEAAVKIKIRGFLKGDSSYLRDRWNHFDMIMISCIYFSIILQVALAASSVAFRSRSRSPLGIRIN